MILYRPHRGGLKEAMAEKREFESLGQLIDTIVEEHNQCAGHIFHLRKEDLCLLPYSDGDDRIGWEDLFLICVLPTDCVGDKEGCTKYYGSEFNYPQHFGGWVTTKWK